MVELCSLLVNMRRESQLAVAAYLRPAIWNWIDIFPHEFNEAIRTRGRMEGSPERVYELLVSNIPVGHERIYWPTLSALVCCTTDKIRADLVSALTNSRLRKVYSHSAVFVTERCNSFLGHKIRRDHHETPQWELEADGCSFDLRCGSLPRSGVCRPSSRRNSSSRNSIRCRRRDQGRQNIVFEVYLQSTES